MSTDYIIPRGAILRHTFQGHTQEINRIAWSPNGHFLASSSFDKTVRIWDVQTDQLFSTFTMHTEAVYSVAWSPDGTTLASCSKDKHVVAIVGKKEERFIHSDVGEHAGNAYDIAWLLYSSAFLASCSEDQTIKIWGIVPSRTHFAKPLQTLRGHASEVFCLAYPPRNNHHVENVLASGSSQGPIRLWEVMGQPLETLRGHTAAVYSMAWSPGEALLASGSEDQTIRLWEPLEGRQKRVLTGHTEAITGISFSADGRLLASKSRDGTVRIWRTDIWETVAILDTPASNGVLAGIAFHPTASILATVGGMDRDIQVWELDVDTLFSNITSSSSTHYANAKVVLVGDSGVGKTALGLVLTGQPFAETSSTHGRYVRNFDSREVVLADGSKEHRDTLLWDLAGQSNYRLIHQLHLNEVAVALLVCTSKEHDPLAGVYHWARALRTAQYVQGNVSLPIKKFLVEARVDRGYIRINHEEVDALLQKLGLDGYIDTSALENKNIAELREMIRQAIDWDTLPKVTSTELFHSIMEFLVEQKEAGHILLTSDNLYRMFLQSGKILNVPADLRNQFETCIRLVESQGLIRRLSFGSLILLQPELLDAYASALVNAAGNDPDGLGSMAESKVRDGNFALPTTERIEDREQEKLLLLAMIEDLLRYEIMLREQAQDGTYLVFPSEVTRTYTNLLEPTGETVTFAFEGPVFNIYATLAVRLSHSGVFRKENLWQDAISFTARMGGICGIALRNIEEGKGELTLFFSDVASEETRFQFEDYVKVHLERYTLPGTINRRRIFQCSACQEPLTDSQVKRRRERDFDWLMCPVCGKRVSILDGEERLHAEPISLVQEIDHTATMRVEHETAKSVLQGKIETADFDVFLCHNANDKPSVKRVGELLKDKGILPWLDEWELRPGLPWQRVLEKQISSIKAAAVFVGESGMGPWQQQELNAFLREFVRRECPVIPVILANAPREPELPIFLQGMTWVDFRKQEPDPMEQLIWGITGQRRV